MAKVRVAGSSKLKKNKKGLELQGGETSQHHCDGFERLRPFVDEVTHDCESNVSLPISSHITSNRIFKGVLYLCEPKNMPPCLVNKRIRQSRR